MILFRKKSRGNEKRNGKPKVMYSLMSLYTMEKYFVAHRDISENFSISWQ